MEETSLPVPARDGRHLTAAAYGPHDGSPVISLHGTPGSRRPLLPDPALLERVGLATRIDVPAGQLTYIDQKRLELARALALDPELLLLDEWLAGLNARELQVGIELVRSLRKEGLTIVLVEHVMDAIRSLCDRCIVMNTGRNIADGPPAAVLADREVIAAYIGDAVA